jgi:outer membrane protein assembly factor BamB
LQFKDKKVWGKLLPLLAILLIGGITLSGCYGRSQPKGWSGSIVAGDDVLVGALAGKLIALDKTDGSPQWIDVEAGTPGSETELAIYGTPATAGELTYVAGYNGKVYAFVTDHGNLRWVYPREGNLAAIVGDIVVADGRLLFGDAEGSFYALDAATGDKLWSVQFGDKIWASPTVSGDTVYIGCFDKNLYALNTANGDIRWQTDETGTTITTPLVVNDTIYVGSFNRYFYALDATSGTIKWQSENEAGKWFWAGAVAADGVVYAPNLDGKVYMFDATTGRETAPPVDLGGQISADPVLTNGRVILATKEAKIFALDTATATASLLVTLGDSEEVLAPLSADGDIAYIKTQTSDKDTLHAVNIVTGDVVWSQALFPQEEETEETEETQEE